jgi:hypothetical protein
LIIASAIHIHIDPLVACFVGLTTTMI